MNRGGNDRTTTLSGIVSRTLSSWLGVGVRQAIIYCLPSLPTKTQILPTPIRRGRIPGMQIVMMFYPFLFAMLLVLFEVHRATTASDDLNNNPPSAFNSFVPKDSLVINRGSTGSLHGSVFTSRDVVKGVKGNGLY